MTPLRQQMIRDMSLAGISEASQKVYIGAIRTFLRHVRTVPEQVTEQQLTNYILLRQQSPHGTFITHRAALFRLFRDVLRRPWPLFQKKFGTPSNCVFPTLCRMSKSAP